MMVSCVFEGLSQALWETLGCVPEVWFVCLDHPDYSPGWAAWITHVRPFSSGRGRDRKSNRTRRMIPLRVYQIPLVPERTHGY